MAKNRIGHLVKTNPIQSQFGLKQSQIYPLGNKANPKKGKSEKLKVKSSPHEIEVIFF